MSIAKQCANCAKTLRKAEGVWRLSTPLASRRGHSVEIYCGPCANERQPTGAAWVAAPCVHCGRLVYQLEGAKSVPACDADCRERHRQKKRNAQSRAERAAARASRRCLGCGRTFRPGRKDQRHCCEACGRRVRHSRGRGRSRLKAAPGLPPPDRCVCCRVSGSNVELNWCGECTACEEFRPDRDAGGDPFEREPGRLGREGAAMPDVEWEMVA